MQTSTAVVGARTPSPSPVPSRRSSPCRSDDGAPGGREEQHQRRWDHIPADDPSERAAGERVRRKLQFFFMNPIDKWRARGKVPFKLGVQLVKVILVTFQLCLFATNRFSHVSFLQNMQFSLDHLFVLGWDVMREVNAYPPAGGPLAAYSQKRFYETVDYTVNRYYDVDAMAVSGIGYVNETAPPLLFCQQEYRRAHVTPYNLSYTFDGRIRERCIKLTATPAEISNLNFSTQAFLESRDFDVVFVGMTRTTVHFDLNVVRLKLVMPLDTPDCYRLSSKLLLDNSEQDGRMLVTLDVRSELRACAGEVQHQGGAVETVALYTMLHAVVIGVCVLSLVMCMRSLYRAQLLRLEAQCLLRKHYNYQLSVDEHCRFLNLWYLLIIINDGLIIFASLIKIQLDASAQSPVGVEAWDVCAVVLGIGNLLVWVGILRYFGFFSSYNVLILTVKSSMPNVLRFSVCAAICYAGFVFCGWLVLAPYHLKFCTISKTSEALFSLMNGDDMFATFAQVSQKSQLVYWFSKLYIYIFIFFFIYVVISLMISIIMDSYETIKKYYREGFPHTPLDEFIGVRRCDPATGVYRQDEGEALIRRLIKCCSCQQPATDTEVLVNPVA